MVPSARPQEYPEFDRASKAPYVSFPISQELAVCADFLAAAGLILHVTLHHVCEKLFTMTNVRKGSGKFTRDLKECLLMFKSSSMSYFPGVTDCVGVCVCGGGGSWFCFFTMFHGRSCLSCEITLLQISFYLLLSAAVIIQ